MRALRSLERGGRKRRREKIDWRVDENGNFRHRDQEGRIEDPGSRREKQCRGGEVKHEPPSGLDSLLGCSARASDFLVRAVSLPRQSGK